ncbi:MAG: IS1595 family transposase [Gammaproteobacteria bacterium]|nr:IS1595 family transposase [Gammaproteobacteria bacterium]MYJ87625.1 IS1595 family transposase [Paracoccaceae bacterium]
MTKAPGKHDRKTISLPRLMKMFPDNDTAEQWFISNRWRNGVECPCCKSKNIQTKPKKEGKPTAYRCRDCRKDFSVKTDTVMHNSAISFQNWAIGIYLLTTGLKSVSSLKLHRDLGITQKSAWFMAHRIRETYQDSLDGLEIFVGPIEADETYMGGKRKNMPKSKRRKLTGRGAVDKTAIVGVKDRKTNKVKARVVIDTSKLTLQGFINENVEEEAEKYTDESTSYKGLTNHSTVNHSAEVFVEGMVHTNGIESFWSMLKRSHKGTFHKMSPKHLQRYVCEFTGRHNVRPLDTLEIMSGMVEGMEKRRLTYKQLTTDNGLDSGARS